MDKEKVLDFTRRISQCNKSGLTLITYEILFTYLEESKAAYEKAEYEFFKKNIHEAENCLNQLMNTLNFEYEIAKEIYPIYHFCNKQLAMAVVKNKIEEIFLVEKLLKKLYGGFKEASIEDKSLPLMQNNEKIIAGMTYRKNHLAENYIIGEESRGFLV